jgi:acyl-homoserine lactone synthase
VTFASLPRSPCVWEITRFFSVSDPSGEIRRNTVIGDILCGMFEMGLEYKLKAISVVCDTFFLPRFIEQNIKATPLGLPTPYDEGTCISCVLPVNRHQLTAARAARGVTEAALFKPWEHEHAA